MDQTSADNLMDIDRLHSLGEMTDGAAYLIVARFIDTLESRLKVIQEAVVTGDSQTAAALVHQLKGSAANCGFPSLALILSQPHELKDPDIANLEACANESISLWKLFFAREVLRYPDLELQSSGATDASRTI